MSCKCECLFDFVIIIIMWAWECILIICKYAGKKYLRSYIVEFWIWIPGIRIRSCYNRKRIRAIRGHAYAINTSPPHTPPYALSAAPRWVKEGEEIISYLLIKNLKNERYSLWLYVLWSILCFFTLEKKTF